MVPSDYTVNYAITVISPVPADSNLITFSNLTRQISVYGLNIFENGDYNSGQYVPGIYIVTVSALGDNNLDLGESFDVTITVEDPCESSTFGFDSTFVSANPITYFVGDPAITETFLNTSPMITQSETITICPPIEYSVTDSSLIVLTAYNAFTFNPASNQFKIESQLLADAADFPYNLRVHAKYASSIHTYPTGGTFDFKVQINFPACPVPAIATISTPTLANQTIKFGDEPITISVDEFIATTGTVCEYSFSSYTLVEQEPKVVGAKVADYIKFDSNKMTLSLNALTENFEELNFVFKIEA